MKKLFLPILLLFSQMQVMSAFTLTGKVVDEAGMAMPYTNVYVKERPQNGTISDLQGAFQIDEMSDGQSIVVSFVGFRTMEVKLKKAPTDTLKLTMYEQPILLEETAISNKTKKMSHKKQMKLILADVKKQMDRDFPDDNIKYNINSDYGVYNEDAIIAIEDLGGNLIEIPGQGKDGRDKIQLSIDWITRYRDKHTQENYLRLDTTLKKETNAKLVHYADSSRWVHKFLWGSGVKYMFNKMSDSPSKWNVEERDSVTVLTYKESRNILGIVKGELVLNYFIHPYSYRIQKLSQSLVVDVNIPFGYKLNGEQLQMLNTLFIAGDSFEKYRVKRMHIDVKRNILYQEIDDRVAVKEKNVITDIHAEDRKIKEPINFKQTGSIKVNSVQFEVMPFTKSQEMKQYKLDIKAKPE